MSNFINFLTAGILAAAPLLFGLLGELLTEKSGNLNLGVEGMMFMGGIAGISGVYFYEKAGGTSPWAALIIALVCSVLVAGLGALIFSVLTITLRANQNVTGLALTMFGTGFGNYFGEAIGNADPSGFLSVSTAVKGIFNNPVFPKSLVNIPYVGKVLFSHNFMVYLSIALAIVLAVFLNRTRSGLNLRAVGESPATADAAGINVTKYKRRTARRRALRGDERRLRRRRRLGPRLHQRLRLARRRPGDLRRVEPPAGPVVLPDLRRALLYAVLLPHLLHPRLHLRHRPLYRHRRGAGVRQPAAQPVQPAAGQPGAELLPGGPVTCIRKKFPLTGKPVLCYTPCYNLIWIG